MFDLFISIMLINDDYFILKLPVWFAFKERNRVSKSGELVVTSTKFRSQQRNIEDAISRVQDIIKEASFVPGGPSEQQQQHVKKLYEL